MLNETNTAAALSGEHPVSRRSSPLQVDWLGFLSETSEVLFGHDNGPPSWACLVTRLVPEIADWCVLSLGNPDGTPTFITMHRNESASAALLTYAPTERWLARPESAGTEWRTIVAREESNRVPVSIGLTSYISLPLIFRSQRLGRLTLAMSTNRSGFGEGDLQFVRELALRIALTLDNTRLRAEARRAAESREEMMAVVSHDLKNPLTAILVSASLLHDRAKTPDEIQNAKMRRLADSIRLSAERMDGLIGDILDVARLSAGRMPVQMQTVKVGFLMDEVFSKFFPQALQKNIFLERNIQQGESFVVCDQEKIEQVLNHLMTNAIRCTPTNGRIVLSVYETTNGFEFSVNDNGPGIAADKVPTLFERTGHPKENPRSGTGLGLFIAKGLIELHGGALWADSLEGTGSTFSFTLPSPAMADEK